MPDECAVDATEPAAVELTAAVWRTIIRVNRRVNHAIKPKTNEAHWGVEDRWDFAEDGYGDCEDYQLVKRKRLVEAGLPTNRSHRFMGRSPRHPSGRGSLAGRVPAR